MMTPKNCKSITIDLILTLTNSSRFNFKICSNFVNIRTYYTSLLHCFSCSRIQVLPRAFPEKGFPNLQGIMSPNPPCQSEVANAGDQAGSGTHDAKEDPDKFSDQSENFCRNLISKAKVHFII